MWDNVAQNFQRRIFSFLGSDFFFDVRWLQALHVIARWRAAIVARAHNRERESRCCKSQSYEKSRLMTSYGDCRTEKNSSCGLLVTNKIYERFVLY